MDNTWLFNLAVKAVESLDAGEGLEVTVSNGSGRFNPETGIVSFIIGLRATEPDSCTGPFTMRLCLNLLDGTAYLSNGWNREGEILNLEGSNEHARE